MLSPEIMQLAIIALAAISVGTVAYVFIMPYMSGEKKTDKRVRKVAQSSVVRRDKIASQQSTQNRRKQVQDTLDELEAKNKAQKKVRIRTRIKRAGLTLSPQSFYMMSAVFGLICGALTFMTDTPPYIALIAAFAGGVGFPRWVLNFLAKRRQKKFIKEFANTLDIIVRGVKSGLPLNDCLGIIAAESPEPVRSEFADVVEQQRIGVPIAQGLERMYERMPLPEVNFFAIVIAIQQQAGGNLAEALGNLSSVLRDRRKLTAKVRAFSQEAKSSAAIIGALPIVVMLLVYMTTPDYMAILWTKKAGHLLMAASGFWMFCGVMVMRKMINFDF